MPRFQRASALQFGTLAPPRGFVPRPLPTADRAALFAPDRHPWAKQFPAVVGHSTVSPVPGALELEPADIAHLLPCEDLWALVHGRVATVDDRDYGENRATKLQYWKDADSGAVTARCEYVGALGLWRIPREDPSTVYSSLQQVMAASSQWSPQDQPATAFYRFSPFPSVVASDTTAGTAVFWAPSQPNITYDASTATGGRVQRQVGGVAREADMMAHLGGEWRGRLRTALTAATRAGLRLSPQSIGEYFSTGLRVSLESADAWQAPNQTLVHRTSALPATAIVEFFSLDDWHDCVASLYWLHGVVTALGLSQVSVALPTHIGKNWIAVPEPPTINRAVQTIHGYEDTQWQVEQLFDAMMRVTVNTRDPGLTILDQLIELAYMDLANASHNASWDGLSMHWRAGAPHVVVHWPF